MPRAAPSPARRSVAILNQKGGVGKTTVTLGLASAAAAAGRRVLVVDLDPQASSTWVLDHEPADGDVLVADVLAGASIDAAIVTTRWDDGIDVGARVGRHRRGRGPGRDGPPARRPRGDPRGRLRRHPRRLPARRWAAPH